MRLRHLDLFSGIGGFGKAIRWLGHETVGFVEIDPWCRRVLAKHWPEVPQHDNIRTYQPGQFGPVDIITGGFPCQPFSVAGQRRGSEDDRHLWPEMARIIEAERPRYVLGENVAGLVNMALDGVLADLESIGYTARAVVIPAGAVNALHRRDRVWIMAHRNGSDEADGRQCSDSSGKGPERRPDRSRSHSNDRQVTNGGTGQDTKRLPDTDSERQPQPQGADGQERGRTSDSSSVIPHAGRTKPSQRSQSESGVQSGEGGTPRSEPASPGGARSEEDTADTWCERLEGQQQAGPEEGTAIRSGGRPQAARSMDARPDGVSPGLVRSRWADGSWELDLPRTTTDEADRKQKLMAAGNAIVPQLAYEILKTMVGEYKGKNT